MCHYLVVTIRKIYIFVSLRLIMITQNENIHVANTNVVTLVDLANKQMDLYETSLDPREREIRIHNAYAHLYRHIDPKMFVPEAETARNRFIGLTAIPKSPEDTRFCDHYLEYLFA